MSKKRTSLDSVFGKDLDLDDTTEETVTALEEEPAPVKKKSAPAPKPANQEKKGREAIKQQSLYLPEAVYEQVRKLAFDERKKLHDYYLEGLDLVFKKKGLKSIAELTKE